MRYRYKKGRSAFTLIELLVVIAIIAILAVVVILTLNPAELLRESRDSTRISDFATLKSAISLYSVDATIPNLGVSGVCYVSIASGTFWAITNPASSTVTSTSFCAWMATATTATAFAPSPPGTTTSPRSLAGGGWIPINFSGMSEGSPIGSEPLDPLNTAGTSASSRGYFYSYDTSLNSLNPVTGYFFKFAAKMESTKYSASGTLDVESTDGGISPFMYEQGSNVSL